MKIIEDLKTVARCIRVLKRIAGRTASHAPIRRMYRDVYSSDARRTAWNQAYSSVNRIVYGVSQRSYERTEAILKALKARTWNERKEAGLSVGIQFVPTGYGKRLKDNRLGTQAKLPPADVTYARFFLAGWSQFSFLRHVPGVKVERDFMPEWKRRIGKMMTRRHRRAVRQLLLSAKRP